MSERIGDAVLWSGDCRDSMRQMAAEGVLFDACVTDPPYHLTSIVKRFGGDNAAPAQHGTDGAFARASNGFMNSRWDGGDVAFQPETWRAVYDVLKPGAYVVAFASTRGYHRMACAIEDAGFITHPMLAWLFGSGFPKATRLKAPDTEHLRYGGQALKPALEPIYMGQKPMEGTGTENWLRHGTGALNIDASRIPATDSQLADKYASVRNAPPRANAIYGQDARPRSEGNLEPHALGRWPANVILDSSEEVAAAFSAFGESKSSGGSGPASQNFTNKNGIYGNYGTRQQANAGGLGDTGTAARFFYTAKADKEDRAGSRHPTIKPLDLMRYLVRLITPPGGTVLDPFAGSGTTLQAAWELGMKPTGCEAEAEYQADIRRRMEACQVQRDIFLHGTAA